MSGRISYLALIPYQAEALRSGRGARENFPTWIKHTMTGIYDDILEKKQMEVWLCLGFKPLWSLGRATKEELRELIKNA